MLLKMLLRIILNFRMNVIIIMKIEFRIVEVEVEVGFE
jgi:hypothetical protein